MNIPPVHLLSTAGLLIISAILTRQIDPTSRVTRSLIPLGARLTLIINHTYYNLTDHDNE